MTESNPHVVCVGEALIEFVRGGDGRFGIASGGDAFNVAVYLARAGARSALATAVGDDPYSDALAALAAAEGVTGNLMLRVGGRLPGIAVIDTGPDGKAVKGKFANKDGKDCFDPDGDDPEVCWTATAPGADGSFTATDPKGTTVTVTPTKK